MNDRPLISYRALAIAGCCAFGYMGTFVMLWIATQDAQQAAIIQLAITGILVAFAVGACMVGAGAWIVVRIMRHYEDRAMRVFEQQPQAITGGSEYQRLSAPQPARAQLPAPRYIDVPTYHANGRTQPLAAEVVLRSNDDAGQTLEVPYRYLLRFAKCVTPKRDEWTGKPAQFYECQVWFDAQGFLQPSGQTLIWREEYPLTSRLDWLQQFEPASPVTGTR